MKTISVLLQSRHIKPTLWLSAIQKILLRLHREKLIVMKRIIISLLVALSLGSCGPIHDVDPRGETSILLFKLNNTEYYNHILCLHLNACKYNGDYSGSCLQPISTCNPDDLFYDLENGYKMVYSINNRCDYLSNTNIWIYNPHFGFSYSALKNHMLSERTLVIGDIAPWEYMDSDRNVIREINLLDSAPKFEFYLFTFNNMGDYKSKLPYTITSRKEPVANQKTKLNTEFYPLESDSPNLIDSVYGVYIDVFNEIIRNGKLKKYCTLAVKDNEVTIDRPLGSIP